MYYVMKMNVGLTNKFIYFREPPDDYEFPEWQTGKPFKVPGSFSMVAEDEVPTAFSDLLLSKGNLVAYSPKLVDTLDALGVTNVQYVPITLTDAARGVTRDDYRIVNLLGNQACLDVANSTVGRLSDGGRYTSLEEFSLLEDRIQALPGTKTPPLLFRMQEFPYIVIAHEKVKAACEAAGITGVQFVPTQEYL